MIVVADTGPLLALAKIEALNLLSALYDQIIASPIVYNEAVSAGLKMEVEDAVLLERAFQLGEITIRRPTASAVPQSGKLHAGEIESIQLAIELEAEWLLVDDLDARQFASQYFVSAKVATRIKGTLGIIVTAAKQRIINPIDGIGLVQGIKHRPDIWIAPSLCERVIRTLEQSMS